MSLDGDDRSDNKKSDVFDFKSAKDEMEENPPMDQNNYRPNVVSVKDIRATEPTNDLRYGSNKVKVNYSESRTSDFSS